jgi:hypothetical protein
MRRFTLPLVILGCIALAALLTWGALSTATFGGRPPRAEATAGRPEVVTQALPAFARLDVSGSAEVVLVQGREESVVLPAASRKSGFVTAEVRDGTLYVDARDTTRWWDGMLGRHGGRTPQVAVTFTDLEAISAAGTVKVTAGAVKVADLKVEGAGGTQIRIDDLTARRLRLTGAGALRADMAGRVVEQTVTISGAGDYRGGKLVSQSTTVTVAGAGKVVVNAEKTLTATISGAGSVEYFGDPQVTERVSGAGRVKRRDASTEGPRPLALNEVK